MLNNKTKFRKFIKLYTVDQEGLGRQTEYKGKRKNKYLRGEKFLKKGKKR